MKMLVAPLYFAVSLYSYFVLAQVVLYWLMFFNIVNRYHPLVHKISRVLNVLVSPVLHHIRRFIKPIEGMDFAPMLLLFILYVLRYILASWLP